MTDSVTEAIGGAATVVTIVQVALQVRNSYTTVQPAGVSWLTWEMALLQSTGLFIYSLAKELPSATVVNAVVGVLSIIVLVRVLTSAGRRSGSLLLVGGTVVTFALLLLAGATTAAGDVGSLASAVVWLPQAARAVRRHSSAGLSWSFVAAGAISSALWLAYALSAHTWRLAVPPISALIAMAITGTFSLWYPWDPPVHASR